MSRRLRFDAAAERELNEAVDFLISRLTGPSASALWWWTVTTHFSDDDD